MPEDIKTGPETIAPDVSTVEQTQAQPELQDFTVDELLAITQEHDEYFVDNAQYKGIRPLSEQLYNLPESTRKVLANLRASVTKKQQEMAAKERELDAVRQKFEEERRLLTESPWAKKVQELASQVPGEVDPWSPEGIEKLVETKAAQYVSNLIKPLQEEVTASRERESVQSFINQHPEIKTDKELKSAVADIMSKNLDVSIEDAYWIASGKLSKQRAALQAQQNNQLKNEKRDALRMTSTGSNVRDIPKPQFKDPLEALEYHARILEAKGIRTGLDD